MKMRHVANRRRSVSSRAFIALLALVLVIGCVAGGTVAWLVAKTEPVVNTFTYGNINITLAETTGTRSSPARSSRRTRRSPLRLAPRPATCSSRSRR